MVRKLGSKVCPGSRNARWDCDHGGQDLLSQVVLEQCTGENQRGSEREDAGIDLRTQSPRRLGNRRSTTSLSNRSCIHGSSVMSGGFSEMIGNFFLYRSFLAFPNSHACDNFVDTFSRQTPLNKAHYQPHVSPLFPTNPFILPSYIFLNATSQQLCDFQDVYPIPSHL